MAARLASALLRAAGMVQTTHATLRSLEEAARLLLAGASVPGHLLGGRATPRELDPRTNIESRVGSVFY